MFFVKLKFLNKMEELLKKFFEEQGFFVDLGNQIEPDCKLEEDEKVLGEMNDLEKRLYSFISEKEKSHSEIISKIQKADESNDYETLKKLSGEHSLNHQIIELAGQIMWMSINSRFEKSESAIATGVREGFKVVEIYKEEELSGCSIIIPGIGAILSM